MIRINFGQLIGGRCPLHRGRGGVDAPYHTRLEPGAWLVLWVSNGPAPVARTTVTAHRRHLDVGGWSTSAPRGLVEGDVSTISPSGWSCTRARRQGRRAEAAASAADRRADSASAPRGLMEGDVSTISPSGWSCAQRRVGKAGVQRFSSISSGQTGRWCVGSSWASVGRWAPSPSGWGCAQGRVGRGRACRCAAAAAADRRGWCDVQGPGKVPVSCGAVVEGRFHLEVWRSSAADWRKTLTE